MQVIYPPTRIQPDADVVRIFLAGAIDNGAAVDWQSQLESIARVSTYGEEVAMYNPRRRDWDASWEQSLTNEKFVEQVYWEQDKLDECDIAFFFFPKDSVAPITLMEFGYTLAKNPRKVVVAAEPGYWRRGNLEVMCNRSRVQLHATLRGAWYDVESRLRKTLAF